MSETAVLDNEYMTVWYDPDFKIVHHQIHKFIFGQPLREGLMKGTELLKKNTAHKWLSDDRNNGALPKEDSDWAQAEWFPQTRAAGWKYWALVQPEKVIGQMNMKHFTKLYADQGITVKVFSDPVQARKWLESV